jgi:uncharacterized protein (TIGR02271 family)
MSPRVARKQPTNDDATTVAEIVRSEEELAVGTVRHRAGTVRATKSVEHEHVERLVPRGIEHAEVERVLPRAGDDGQIHTLPDGSVSVPVFEEQLVVEKRLVVRERIIIRKHTVVEEHKVEADLRKEQVHVDADAAVAARVSVGRDSDARRPRAKAPKKAAPQRAAAAATAKRPLRAGRADGAVRATKRG